MTSVHTEGVPHTLVESPLVGNKRFLLPPQTNRFGPKAHTVQETGWTYTVPYKAKSIWSGYAKQNNSGITAKFPKLVSRQDIDRAFRVPPNSSQMRVVDRATTEEDSEAFNPMMMQLKDLTKSRAEPLKGTAAERSNNFGGNVAA
jgi:hypothetical protein